VSSSRPGVIDWFFQDPDHGFLCNFHPCLIQTETPHGKRIIAGSVESAYQAHKTKDEDEFLRIVTARAGEAKTLGNATKLIRPDWDTVKFGVMEDLLRKKFMRGSTLARQLRETGDDELIEGTTWHDVIWGICLCETHNGEGDNHLGKLLMKRRAELRRWDHGN
jgi:ribA/ribD-fused uncharacterized protein